VIPYRYQFPIRDLPLDTGLFAIPALLLHEHAVLQTHHGLRGTHACTHTHTHTHTLFPPAADGPLQRRSPPASDRADLGLPIVRGGLIERLAELELDLGGLEGALRLQAHHPVILHAHDQIGLGPIPHLPGREAHTCTAGGRDPQNAWHITQ